MKKLFLCLSLLLAVFTTAAAEIDTSKEYRIKYTVQAGTGNQAKYMNIRSYDSYPTGPIGGIYFVDYAESDEQIFSFEASGTNYKLKTKSGKYIYCHQWNVDAADSGTELTFTSNVDSTYTISWNGGYFKVQNVTENPKATINGIEVTQDQISGYFPYCDAAEAAAAKFELEEVVTIPTSTVITQLSELSNNKAYTATLPNHSKGANGWAVNDTNLKSLNDLSLSQKDSDPNQQFAFLTPDNGTTYYLYSVGKSKYISNTGALTDEPTHPIVFKNGNRTGTFVVYYDADHIVNVGGDKQMTIDNWGPDGRKGFADDGNSIVITAVADFNPDEALSFFGGGSDNVETDRSEELAPLFGKVDIEGIKICNEFGKFSESTYDQYYQHWQSNDQINYWIGTEDDQDIYSVSSIINIKTFIENDKVLSDRFHHDGTDEHRIHFTLTNVLTGMQIEAAEGYNIVGYCFDYTASDAITDIDGIDGEIVSEAGTHHVEVKGIETSSTEILFGKSSNKDIVISHFYVFVRRGMLLTKNQFDRFSNLLLIPFAFTLAPQNNPEHHVYAPEGSDILDACGPNCKKHSDKTVTGTDLKQQFVLLPFDSYWINYPSYNGMYFLYNLGAKKFVSAEGGKAILTEYPIQAASIEAGEEGFENCFRINFNKTNLLNVSTEDCNQEPTSSCVNTSNNEHDGGNHFYLRAVREFDYEPGDVSNQIFAESYYIEDPTLLNEKGAELKAILDQDGPGYPTDDLRETLTQYYNNVTTYKEATAFFGLSHFLPEYKSTTSVKMPENGKAYRIKTILNYGTNEAKERYLKGTADGHLTIVNSTTAMADNSSIFVAKSMDEAADGQGTFAFVNDNGQFLVGARTNTNGFTEDYEQDNNNANLKLTTTANKDYFGGFLLKTTENNNTYNLQLGQSTESTDLVIKYDDKNPNAIFADASGSSIFYLEEASYPNVVKLREPAVTDGKAYSSIWLPFSVEIPEGVRAYKAHVDYTTNQLVCGEVKNILPGGQGAILISEKAQEIVLAPATADVAPLQDNDLKGTNVTLARDEKVTTFVLNGSKGEIGFYPYTGTNIAKYKAYVQVDKELAAQGLRFSFGTATDIENTLTEGEGEAKEYYDLSGRRVAQPTKGLYIVNGKKMYIK